MKISTETFVVNHFAFDGETLGSTTIGPSELSERWFAVADALLSDGPVFNRTLGSTLDHYEIKCTAGICEFRVSGAPAFFGILLPQDAEEQNQKLFEVFAAQLRSSRPVKDGSSDTACLLESLASIKVRPACIVINWFNADVAEVDQEAMFQFVYHFAAAYFQWLKAA
jgi:hypothetical protein